MSDSVPAAGSASRVDLHLAVDHHGDFHGDFHGHFHGDFDGHFHGRFHGRFQGHAPHGLFPDAGSPSASRTTLD